MVQRRTHQAAHLPAAKPAGFPRIAFWPTPACLCLTFVQFTSVLFQPMAPVSVPCRLVLPLNWVGSQVQAPEIADLHFPAVQVGSILVCTGLFMLGAVLVPVVLGRWGV